MGNSQGHQNREPFLIAGGGQAKRGAGVKTSALRFYERDSPWTSNLSPARWCPNRARRADNNGQGPISPGRIREGGKIWKWR